MQGRWSPPAENSPFFYKPKQEELEQFPQIVPTGGKQGVDFVTFCTFEVVSIHPVVSFQVTDNRFNGTSSLVPCPFTWLHAALSFVGQVDGGAVH